MRREADRRSKNSKRFDRTKLAESHHCLGWDAGPGEKHDNFLPIRSSALAARIVAQDEFVLRYETEDGVDGLSSGEGAFLGCSLWLVDNYILQDRDEDARRLFERLLTRCNDVGLLAEEFDPAAGRMLGNFPQAYSHVGLINSALSLSEYSSRKERAAPRSTGRGARAAKRNAPCKRHRSKPS